MWLNIVTLGVIALVTLLVAWIVNASVGLLMGKEPKDTGSLWFDTFVEFLCFGTIGRYLNGLGVHGWPRKAIYIAGCVGVAIFLVRSCH
jgi:hypothetical protein